MAEAGIRDSAEAEAISAEAGIRDSAEAEATTAEAGIRDSVAEATTTEADNKVASVQGFASSRA